MIIAQISDTHITLDAPDAGQRIKDFERTIADINALDPAPDVIVHTGDIVHNGRPDEYARAMRILAKARAPVYVLAGNKDDRANLRAAFSPLGYLAPDAKFIDYAVEDYPVRLIAVDTLSTAGNRGDFCPERARRLIDMIDAETSKPVAVFAHHPPFEVKVGPDPINFETLEAMERLRRALQHSGRVVAVFSGHVHRPAEGHVGRIPAIVMPCIATTLRKGEYPPHMKTRPVYYVHRFDPDGGFTTEARIVGAGPAAASTSDSVQPQREPALHRQDAR
jgi:3',5'-cyclic AMP phosphodiesterase CpdA